MFFASVVLCLLLSVSLSLSLSVLFCCSDFCLFVLLYTCVCFFFVVALFWIHYLLSAPFFEDMVLCSFVVVLRVLALLVLVLCVCLE